MPFLIGELSPLILSNINDQWMLTPVIFLVVVFVCFPSLSCVGGGLLDVCTIVGAVGFLGLSTSVFLLVHSVRLGLWIHIV